MIDPSVPPTGTGCVECLAAQGWWFHLRRCAACGHIGCCDSSPPGTRVTATDTGHRIMCSFEPGETWFWDFAAEQAVSGPPLAQPSHRPVGQPAPGPAGRVPKVWRRRLH
jgi:hypothetical protein